MQAAWEVKAAYLAGASDLDSAVTAKKECVPRSYMSTTTHLPIKHHFQRRAEHRVHVPAPLQRP